MVAIARKINRWCNSLKVLFKIGILQNIDWFFNSEFHRNDICHETSTLFYEIYLFPLNRLSHYLYNYVNTIYTNYLFK